MPLYRISGKFANGHTFSTTVDGETPKDALMTFQGFDDVKNYGHPVTQVSVVQQQGKSRIRISETPAKPRKPREKKAAPVASAASGNVKPAAPSRR